MNRWVKLAGLLVRPAHWRALAQGVAASLEHEGYLASLECQTVVDIGANRGQFSLMARTIWPDAKIIAFEPLAAPAARFISLFGGDDRVELHQAAVGETEQRTLMHVSSDDDSSSLLPLTSLQTSLFPGTEERRTEQVSVGRLRSYVDEAQIAAPALLKLDVQGFELNALRGCGSLLNCFDVIIVECSFEELYTGQALAHDIVQHLHRQAFVLESVYNVTYRRGRAVQAEFGFRRSTG